MFFSGLTENEVNKYHKRYGYNKLEVKETDSLLKIFFSQFTNPLTIVLLLAAGLIFITNKKIDGFIISGILLFNAVIGTVQEGKAKKILSKIKKYIKEECIVIREKQKKLIHTTDLVPNDIIVLEEGMLIPADCNVLESYNIKVDEAIITGESEPKIKEINDKLYQGTYILTGHGIGIIENIGKNTKIGLIQKTISNIEDITPLKKDLKKLSKIIIFVIITCCLILFIAGYIGGIEINKLISTIIALFICLVPEGLPLVLTITLINSAYKLSKKDIIVKKLHAIESLGRINTIVADKTGTLTYNEITVKKVYADKIYTVSGEGFNTSGYIEGNIDDKEKINILVESAFLLDKSLKKFNHKASILHGEPTQAALGIFARKMNYKLKNYNIIYEKPFTGQERYQIGLYKIDNSYQLYMNGAPETVINKCKNFTEKDKKYLQELLDNGYRVIACAHKEFKEEPQSKDTHNNLNFIGFYGLIDDLRPHTKDEIENAYKNKINVIMATGDHPTTAYNIAKKAGICNNKKEVITGLEFANESHKSLKQMVNGKKVFARFSPHEKYELVKILQSQQKIVMMTGDGVNDGPALQIADVGVALSSATEVAKEAADIIFLKDSFKDLMEAIDIGKCTYQTIKRVIVFFFASNLTEMFVVMFSIFSNNPLLLTPAQILWLNLVTDGFLDVSLALEPCYEKSISEQNLDLKKQFYISLFQAIPMALGTVAIFYLYRSYPIHYLQTMILLILASFQWYNAINCKSLSKSIFKINFLENKYLIAALFLVISLQVMIVYVKPLNFIFNTVPLGVKDWTIALLFGTLVIFTEEIRKKFIK